MYYDLRNLRENIKKGDFHKVYLIEGNEPYLKQKYAKLLADSVVPAGFEAFNKHVLKGEDITPDEIMTCVEALPVMAERTCVFVKDYPFSDSVEDERKKFLTLLSDLPDTCTLIFWQDTKELSGRSDDIKEIRKLIEANGAVCTIDKRSDSDLIKYILIECKRRERQIDNSTAMYLIETVGNDVATILNEVAKLCSYTKSISKEDIDVICVKTLEATTFKVVDALLSNNFDMAFSQLQVLFEQKTAPELIIGSIASAYIDMYRVKVAESAAKGYEGIKGAFSGVYKSPYRLNNASKRARKYTVLDLRRALEVLGVADEKCKNTFDDRTVIIEKLIIELAMVRKHK
ncbi:MAG: DNA polymerase III subunit delta [Ruminococcaceae bacterium]|nr:DNA polymerase III subunit delta [Oscillospiraceae bacterium]